jgi:hypothetical protein
MTKLLLTIAALLAFTFSAWAQTGGGAWGGGTTTTMRPDGSGGYNVYTPSAPGQGGAWGGGTTGTIRPDGSGGYTVDDY